MLEFIDAHAHYDDEKYDEDRDEIIKAQFNNGVLAIVNASSDLESSKKAVDLANRYDKIYAVVGCHPHEAKGFKDEDLKLYEDMLENKKVVGVGECGLDYYYDLSEREIQKRVFEAMIAFANQHYEPLVIHSREAVKDTIDMLSALRKDRKTLIHCFTGPKEVARDYLNLGYSLSIGGVLTFKNAKHVVEALQYIPMDRILLETDSPYMTPEPYRGQRNMSIYINQVIERIADIKKIEKEEVAEQTNKNAKEFYGI